VEASAKHSELTAGDSAPETTYRSQWKKKIFRCQIKREEPRSPRTNLGLDDF